MSVLDALAVLAGAPEEGARLVVLPAPAWPRALARRAELRALLVALPSARAPVRLAAPDRQALLWALPARGRARRLARSVVAAVPGAAAATRLAGAVAIAVPEGSSAPLPVERLVADGDLRRLALAPSRHHLAVAGVWGPRGTAPVAWVKVGDVAAEERALRELGPTAASAGARVPAVLGRDGAMLATAPLPGEHAHRALARDPARLEAVVDELLSWLVAWRERSLAERELTAADVDRLLLAPARELAADLDPAYAGWLADAFGPLDGRRCALSAAHQDLTMFNVLLDGGRLGVIDWEAATAAALPFADAPYAVVDAAAAGDRYADRVASFERVFGEPGSPLRARVAALAGAGTDRLACSAAFHACWLAHAADDRRRDGAAGEFVRIAARLSADPRTYDPFAG